MKIEKQSHTQTVSLWAIPKSAYDLKYDREIDTNAPAFRLAIRTDRPWAEGAVMVLEQEVTMEVPEGIDITVKAVETLQEAKAEIIADTARKLKELDEQIQNLLCITYQG
jgi:hypothetical protein